ncbi:hypothetical protein R1sor_005287 [Riccia sorocarpa]|uniref:Uncharacterized protein n=1 Tax=Riccia sorocarpa TaxID=122646 RepID=A0ABD3HL31_9MARC
MPSSEQTPLIFCKPAAQWWENWRITILWTIWSQRNDRVFRDIQPSLPKAKALAWYKLIRHTRRRWKRHHLTMDSQDLTLAERAQLNRKAVRKLAIHSLRVKVVGLQLYTTWHESRSFISFHRGRSKGTLYFRPHQGLARHSRQLPSSWAGHNSISSRVDSLGNFVELKRIVGELLQLEAEKEIGASFGDYARLLEYEAVNHKMHYLQAAILEAMRLYPLYQNFRSALKDDILPACGTTIRAGASFMYIPYSQSRMEQIWGEDCLEYKPERWLRDGICHQESQFKYPVFHVSALT